MYYTREPIVETVVTPKEGCKLVLRNSKKGHEQEDFFVDAVEVVSFGSSLFFRSQERPKPFLLPVADYEVLELKETKMVLKAASHDRAIKIAGGKEASSTAKTKEKEETPSKKAVKRRHRRKKTEVEDTKETEKKNEAGESPPQESQPPARGLLPPPSMLIREKLKQIKEEGPQKVNEEVVSIEAAKQQNKEEKPVECKQEKQ